MSFVWQKPALYAVEIKLSTHKLSRYGCSKRYSEATPETMSSYPPRLLSGGDTALPNDLTHKYTSKGEVCPTIFLSQFTYSQC
jgi:hypothetical protein